MSSVAKLARTLGGTDLAQPEAREALLAEAQMLVVNQDWSLNPRTIALLEVAMALTRLLGESSTKEANAMDAMVRRLVSFAKVEAEKAAKAPPAVRPATREGYRELDEGVERSVGSILMRMGEVSQDELNDAGGLRLAGEKLGEALVRTGRVGDAVLGNALRLQTSLVKQSTRDVETTPIVDEFCLGEVLVGLTWIDRPKLDEGLRIQRATGMRLGEALVQMGVVSWYQVQDAIRIQRRERKRKS